MIEKWDASSTVGAVVIAVIFGCLAITIGGGWKTIAGADGQTLAAWFQGVGSVAAIWAAVWLHQRGNREANSRAEAHAVIFRISLTDLLLACSKAAELRERGTMSDCIFVARDVAHIGQSIQLDRLHELTMVRVSQWRTTVARAQSLLEQWNAQPDMYASDFISLRREFDRMLTKVAESPQS